MRKPQYLSPTSVGLFLERPQEFYLKYCAEARLPRMPQTPPMSIGSAFDARVKNWLIQRLKLPDPKGEYTFQTLFDKQVEAHNREWALPASEWCFAQYKNSGALVDLLRELGLCDGLPQFEFAVTKNISTDIGDVPITGRPDIYFRLKGGRRVLLDWKVNGFCSNSPTSPTPGYVICRDAWHTGHKQTRGNLQAHPDAYPQSVDGILLSHVPLENADAKWATQLITYAWLLGEPVGEDDGLIIGIEQLVGQPRPSQEYPDIRVASHRSFCTKGFQQSVLNMYRTCWDAIQRQHIFISMTHADSMRQQDQLERAAAKWVEHTKKGPDAPFDLTAWTASLMLGG